MTKSEAVYPDEYAAWGKKKSCLLQGGKFPSIQPSDASGQLDHVLLSEFGQVWIFPGIFVIILKQRST